jgi:hypothetical protein
MAYPFLENWGASARGKSVAGPSRLPLQARRSNPLALRSYLPFSCRFMSYLCLPFSLSHRTLPPYLFPES